MKMLSVHAMQCLYFAFFCIRRRQQLEMSILSYFQPIDEALYREVLHSSTVEVSTTQVCVSRELNQMMAKKSKKNTKQTVPEMLKEKLDFVQINRAYQQLVNGQRKHSGNMSSGEKQFGIGETNIANRVVIAGGGGGGGGG